MTLEQRLIQFAQSYSAETASSLTAYVALYRLEALLADAHTLKAALEAGGSLGNSWFGFEIFSYYSAGFVTCLEWHARARVVDLFTYRPESIEPGDFKHAVNTKFFTQMVKDNVRIPELLGGMVSVGSADAYITAFTRIFKALDFRESPWDVLRTIIIKVVDVGDETVSTNLLESLFAFRNHLVHEIDSAVVGRAWQRDAKTLEQVIEEGKIINAAIRALEVYLSRNAPKHFPNLLDEEGFPNAEHENIEEQINALEAELRKVFADDDEKQDKWDQAVAAAAESIALHDDVISSAPILGGTMYIRLRAALHLANRRRRLDFLLFLKKQVDSWANIKPQQWGVRGRSS